MITVIQFATIGAIFMYIRSRGTSWQWAATVAAGNLILGALYLYQGSPGGAGFNGPFAAIWAWIAWHDWKNRPPRSRKKALKALGHKALALLRAMKENMPRVRQPVPA